MLRAASVGLLVSLLRECPELNQRTSQGRRAAGPPTASSASPPPEDTAGHAPSELSGRGAHAGMLRRCSAASRAVGNLRLQFCGRRIPSAPTVRRSRLRMIYAIYHPISMRDPLSHRRVKNDDLLSQRMTIELELDSPRPRGNTCRRRTSITIF